MQSERNVTPSKISSGWRAVIEQLQYMGPRVDMPLSILDQEVNDLDLTGFTETSGLPAGQRTNWRATLPDGSGLHVKVMQDDSWMVHIDEVSPLDNMMAHAWNDVLKPRPAAMLFTLGVLAVGAFVIHERRERKRAADENCPMCKMMGQACNLHSARRHARRKLR